MRAVLVLAASAVALALPAHAQAGSCVVDQDPVLLGGAWSVTATGLSPDSTFWLNVTQAKDPSNNAHPNWSLTTGADGAGTAAFPSTTWAVDGILGAGRFKVRVYAGSLDEDASGSAQCWGRAA